jgi:hypothetical protein
MRRRQLGDQQQIAAPLAHQIVEMKHRAFGGAIRMVDQDRGVCLGERREIWNTLALEVGRIEQGSARLYRPDAREMGLAAARRTAQSQRRRGPVGPAVDPGQRLAVAVGDDEVLARKRRRRQRQVERQLLDHGQPAAPPR